MKADYFLLFLVLMPGEILMKIVTSIFLVDFSGSISGFEFIRLAHEFEHMFNVKIELASRGGI